MRIISSGRKVFRRPLQQPSTATSVDFSMDSPQNLFLRAGPTPEQSIADEYGRGFNTSSQVYRLPADATELERLSGFLTANPISLLSSPWVDAQHKIIKMVVGQYPPIVHTVMADDNPDEQKAILDLGCGSGAWLDIFLFIVDVRTSWADLSSKDYRGCKRFPTLHRGRCRSGSYAICVGPLSSIHQITCSFFPAGICLPIAG